MCWFFCFIKDWKEKFTDNTLYLFKHNPAARKYLQQTMGILHQQKKQRVLSDKNYQTRSRLGSIQHRIVSAAVMTGCFNISKDGEKGLQGQPANFWNAAHASGARKSYGFLQEAPGITRLQYPILNAIMLWRTLRNKPSKFYCAKFPKHFPEILFLNRLNRTCNQVQCVNYMKWYNKKKKCNKVFA